MHIPPVGAIVAFEVLTLSCVAAAPACDPALFPRAERLQMMKGRDNAMYLVVPDGSNQVCAMDLQTGVVEMMARDQLAPDTNAAAKSVSGTWHDLHNDHSLELVNRGDYIQLNGTATADMSTAGDPMDIRAATISGRLKLNSGWSNPLGECHVQARSVGSALVVRQREDTSCGGFGVSFSGVYTQQ
jgi:hypothetical protein